MSFGSNLIALRESRGISRKELAEMLEIPYTTLRNYETDQREPGHKLLIRLASIFSVSVDELIGNSRNSAIVSIASDFTREERDHIKKYRILDGYGKRAVDAVLEAEHDRMTHVVEKEQKAWTTYINCYDLAVSAGPGEPWVDDAYVTQLKIPTEKVPDKAHYCARVNGDSMEPAYKDGDIVFAERLDGSVREGEIGIFALNGAGYIKRLGHHELISLNPEYPPILIGEFDDLRCQGRVLGKL